MKTQRLLLIAALAGLLVAYFALDLGRFLSIDYFKSQQEAIEAWRAAQPVKAGLLFFVAYVAVTGLSLPGAAVMTLAGGADLRPLLGLLLVSFASSLGATLAFLASRFLLRDWVQKRFGDRMRAINAGIDKEGGFYLFTLRLVPLFPFFVINLVMGLTPLKTRTFYWVSQLGMLAGTLVYVNAGTQLARIDSLAGILSPALLGSFVLLGIFPLLAKKIVDALAARKVYAGWQKPARFERNLIVIGAGSAGLVTAYIAAAVKAKVTLIEKHKLGGDCLNTGCVPSKAVIRSAKLLSHMQRSQEFGIREAKAEFDFADVMERVQRVIKAVEPHDSAERYTELGVEVIAGSAKIVSPWEVEFVRNSGEQRAADDAQHRHRHRRPALRAAATRHRRGRLSHLRHHLGAAPTAAPAAGPRRRPDRLRTDAGLRPFRRAGHAGAAGATDHGPRRSRSLGNGHPALPRRRHHRAAQSPGESLCRRGRREDPARRTPGRGSAHSLRHTAGGGRPGSQPETATASRNWASRGSDDRPTTSCKRNTRTSTPPATSPGPSSSPTRLRTRPGTRPSMRSSIPSRSSAPITR
jgi:uncharacterized membrane protein YdjX (TVP38/TMEM64 family)